LVGVVPVSTTGSPLFSAATYLRGGKMIGEGVIGESIGYSMIIRGNVVRVSAEMECVHTLIK
jgi:hypothetical protein